MTLTARVKSFRANIAEKKIGQPKWQSPFVRASVRKNLQSRFDSWTQQKSLVFTHVRKTRLHLSPVYSVTRRNIRRSAGPSLCSHCEGQHRSRESTTLLPDCKSQHVSAVSKENSVAFRQKITEFFRKWCLLHCRSIVLHTVQCNRPPFTSSY